MENHTPVLKHFYAEVPYMADIHISLTKKIKIKIKTIENHMAHPSSEAGEVQVYCLPKERKAETIGG